MKRFSQPFFRPKKNRWYVQLDGKQINLGPNETEAWAKYHEIMVDRARNPPPKIIPIKTTFVACVLDAYLDWLKNCVQEGSKAQRTYDWYFDYLQSFLKDIGPLPLDQLGPIHVYQWVDSKPGWKSGKRGAMTALQRAMTWAAKAGLLKDIGGKSPLASLEKPQQGRREQLVTEEEYRKVLALASDQEFQDLLELSWETGARPNELFTVIASYVDLANARWIFPVKESKGKKIQRVVYLTDKALAITQRLVLKNEAGPLLLNTDGVKWTGAAVNCRFQRIREKLGVKYSLYALRHSFCTFALEAGQLDAVTVAVLMDTAQEAGLTTEQLWLNDLGWEGRTRRFVNLQDQPIDVLFKLHPWETLINEQFGAQAIDTYSSMQWIEPAWKMVVSNKAILALLWELNPNHPNLLPAFANDKQNLVDFVKKPFLSREGANVTVVRNGITVASTEGDYGKGPFVYQRLASLPEFDGMHPVIGSWLIDHEAHGIGIRESKGLVTDDLAHFVPHLFR